MPEYLSLPDVLRLESGPATIVPPEHIGFLEYAPKKDGETVCQVDDEHEAGLHLSYFSGDFSDFHLYAIVTHTKISIKPGSTSIKSSSEFEATIEYRSEDGELLSRVTKFKSPYPEVVSVGETKYGVELNAFSFKTPDGKDQRFPCNLPFMANFSDFVMPLRVEYIGMAAKNGRTADERLADGHEKLQALQSKMHSYNTSRAISLLLYRPGRLDNKKMVFDDVVETLEATLIQHFQPRPLNIEHLNFPAGSPSLSKKLRSIGVQWVSAQLEAPRGCRIYSNHRGDMNSVSEAIVNIPKVEKNNKSKRKRK